MKSVVQDDSILVQLLRRFNRKERYWLLMDALGVSACRLSEDYRDRLGKVLEPHIPKIHIPEDAWWAMDYHFDWLHAALEWFSCSETPADQLSAWDNPMQAGGKRPIQGNQEDIDLIVAFGSTLLLIEAKGEGAWSQSQMESKAKRIAALPRPKELTVRLLLTGRADSPKKIAKGKWWDEIPPELKNNQDEPTYLQLSSFRDGNSFCRVIRCNEAKKPNKEGDFWAILPQRLTNSTVERAD
ncbi:hypothetical protein V5F31_08195 [Xanthobacter sp. V7C-4]|uniref:hypothetical protein n=1 Tax=Xanthobacter autotrophicus (strain ATCC BAA-1158 / Py2) TaxID=78245 RepID=UPI00372CCE6B